MGFIQAPPPLVGTGFLCLVFTEEMFSLSKMHLEYVQQLLQIQDKLCYHASDGR